MKNPPPNFIVRRGNERWEFNTAGEVAVFMWGRDMLHYQVYCLIRQLPCGDMEKFEQHLENVRKEGWLIL